MAEQRLFSGLGIFEIGWTARQDPCWSHCAAAALSARRYRGHCFNEKETGRFSYCEWCQPIEDKTRLCRLVPFPLSCGAPVLALCPCSPCQPISGSHRCVCMCVCVCICVWMTGKRGGSEWSSRIIFISLNMFYNNLSFCAQLYPPPSTSPSPLLSFPFFVCYVCK